MKSSMGSDDKHDDKSLGIGLKVMLAAAFSLFGMIILIIIFHFSVKFIIRRQQRRRQNELLHQMSTQIAPIDVTSVEPRNSSGLDTLIIASLPKLLYKQTNQFNKGEVIECSVCLGTIVEDAITRVLPNCKHVFHVDCVDKWFTSNTTCPICRTAVDPKEQPKFDHLVNPIQPTAPPEEGGDEAPDDNDLEKVGCSGLRIGSFHRMVSNREQSGRRTQSCDESNLP